MKPLHEKLQIGGALDETIMDRILELMDQALILRYGTLAALVASDCGISEDYATYLIWALIERNQLKLNRDMKVEL